MLCSARTRSAFSACSEVLSFSSSATVARGSSRVRRSDSAVRLCAALIHTTTRAVIAKSAIRNTPLGSHDERMHRRDEKIIESQNGQAGCEQARAGPAEPGGEQHRAEKQR